MEFDEQPKNNNEDFNRRKLIMTEIVKEINELCKEYIGFVESAGNECAYTDGIVECIIEKTNELKTKYDEEV